MLLAALIIAVFVGTAVTILPWTFSHMTDQVALHHPPPTIFLGALAGTEIAAILCLLALLPWASGTSLAELGFRAPDRRAIAIAVAGALAMVIITNGLGSLLQSVLHVKASEQAVALFLSLRTPAQKALFAFIGIIAVAAAEEMAFRLFLFNAIRKYGRFWIAAIASGIIFGAAHGQPGTPLIQNVIVTLPLALGGVILATVYEKTRNAYAPMITHGLFNAVSFVALFFAPQLGQ